MACLVLFFHLMWYVQVQKVNNPVGKIEILSWNMDKKFREVANVLGNVYTRYRD